MESIRTWQCVDSHTEGMPTRVVVGGVGVLPGSTMEGRRRYIIEQADDLRTWLMFEPHGHAAMSGAILATVIATSALSCRWYIEGKMGESVAYRK